MKKYASLLLFALLLNGCDDGDLTVETFDFDDESITIQNCSDTYELLYKLKSQESLLLQMPEGTLINEATGDGDPQEFDIDNNNFKLVYRAYNGTVATQNICDAIRPSSPNITNEWYAKSGKIEIITTASYTTNETDNSTRISGYSHTISFKNVTITNPPGDQVEPAFVFGTFVTDADDLNLEFTEAPKQCPISKQVYTYSIGNATSLTLDNIDPSLIVNEATPVDNPRTALVSATNNIVSYKVYDYEDGGGLISAGYFCNTTTPTTPIVKETWIGQNGITTESAIIEVTTTTLGTAFKHVIVLKNVSLSNGNVSFELGNNFLLGELITN